MQTKKITTFYFIVCLLLFSHTSFSQSCNWAKAVQNNYGNTTGNFIATDNFGNSYVTGQFTTTNGTTGPTSFGNGITLSSYQPCAFIAKYDVSGNCIWAKKVENAFGNTIGNGIAVDASFNVYVTGQFTTTNGTTGPTSFGNGITLSSYKPCAFVAKYDPSGNCLWAKKVENNAGNTIGNGIAVDASSNVYTTGQFTATNGTTGPASFGNGINLSSYKPCGFVAKYDVSGNCLWAKKVEDAFGNTIGNGIAVDASSNVYTTGQFTTINGTTGPASFGNGITLSSYQPCGFVAKYDVSGNCLWAKKVEDAFGNTIGNGIAVDASSNVYTTGQFTTTNGTTGPASFGNGINLSSYQPCGFVAKYDISGNCLWAKKVEDAFGNTIGNGIAVDASSNVYTTGQFTTTNGTTGPASFGNGITLSSYKPCAFVAKYDISGNCLWANKVENAFGNTIGKSIAVTNCSQFYVTGQFTTTNGTTGPTSFGNGINLSSYQPCGFVAKYSYINPILTLSSNGYIYPGSTGSFTYTVNNPSNMPLTYQWQYSPDGINWYSVTDVAPYSGANTPSLTITNAPASIAGFKYRLIVNGVCFTTTTGSTSVCPLSNVSLTTFNNVCITDSPFTLSGGSPAGGTYYIYKNNVSTNTPSTTFDPLSVGLGTHTIVYTYSYASGCSYSASQVITVGNPSINTVSAQSCNSSVPVPFTISCPFFPGNVFKAQLSKPDGTFDPSPYTIGTLTSTTAGTINGTLPTPLTPGTYKIRVVGTNPSVVGIETTLVLNNCRVGSDNIELNNEVNLYPNPATESAKLEIAFATILKVELIDINGRIIRILKPEYSQEIDLTGISNGLYIIKIQTSEGITNKKLQVNN